MRYIWQVPASEKLSLFDQLVNNRNLKEDFFYASLKDIPNLSLVKDLDRAAQRIIKALQRKERIMIFGDDDIDGITSTYILFDFFSRLGFQDHYAYIPNRILNNHGMQEGFFQVVKNRDISLVITVDGGVSAVEQVKKLNSMGCQVIITDHHEVPEILPDAFAIVNCKQRDCAFPFKMLAGVGITYLLIKKIAEQINMVTEPSYLFWVAVGTISDKVPLEGLNRILVKEVIENWYEFEDDTLDVLNKYFWFPGDFSSRMAIFRYLIKLLANGREAAGDNAAFRLLTLPKSYKNMIVKSLIKKRNAGESELNALRRKTDKLLPDENESCFIYFDKDDDIPHQYLGLSASSISKQYMIPTVFLKGKGEVIVCEVRCTEGFDFIKAFESLQELLIQWGGHQKAAGFTMEEENLEKFIELFRLYAEKQRETILANRKLVIDCVLDKSQISELMSFVQIDLPSFQPFGEGNPEPLFLIRNYRQSRDGNSLGFADESALLSDVDYDIVFNFRGSSFYIIDYRESQKNKKQPGEI
ncbi:MAG: DHH family phosphoesterase [Candidatus Cloacimonetes bacterium]|nr:DHH family phosphoesterase [Candidatus Cloacimonadota bacterium]